jgi:hypothetical protein
MMADDQTRARRLGWQAVIRRARSSGGFATVGTALAILTVTSLVLVGANATRSSFRFGSGFAWLGSNHENEAMLVNGATGQGTDRLNLPDGGVRLEVRTYGEHTYVVQVTKDGERILYRLDDANPASAAQRPIGRGQVLTRSGDRAWLVDRDGGTVDPVDPDTLASSPVDGAPFRFTPPILDAPDGQGRLVVVEETTARAVVVADRPGAPSAVGSPGDRLAVSAVDEHPVVVNLTRAEVHVYADGTPTTVTLPAGGGRLEVAPAGEGGALALLRRDGTRGELLLVDLTDRSVRGPVAIEGGVPTTAGPPYAVAGAVFLVDPAAGAVLVVDPGSGRLRQRVPIAVSRDSHPDAFVKDGRLWVNDTDSEHAVIVERDGRHHDIDKYDPKVPEVGDAPDAPAGGPRPDPRPSPGPAPRGGPAGAGDDRGPNAPVGAPSGPPAGSPPPAVVTAPGAPPQFSARGANASVELSWQAGNDGGARILGYRLQCAPDCGGGARERDVPPGETFTVTGLRNGENYTFRLRALNEAGAGPDATAGARPTADVPPAPTAVQAVANNNGTVTVTWRADGGGLALSGFTIDAATANPAFTVKTASFGPVAATGGPAYSFTTRPDELGYDDDTEPDWTFSVSALAGDKTGTKAASNAVDPFNRPRFTGTGLSADEANGQVSLVWSAATANGRPVDYKVLRCTGAGCTGFTDTGLHPGAGAGQQTVTGLANGTTYRFRVVPHNEAGDGPPIESGDVVPRGQPQLVFGAHGATGPNGIQAVFTIQWLGPVGTCRQTAGPAGQVNCGAGTYRSTASLNPATNYTVTLCATGPGGDGCASVTIRTDPPPPPPTYNVTIENNSGSAEAYNNTGAGAQVGPSIAPGTVLAVRCRKRDATIRSNPGDYWYQVATAPWTNAWLPASVTDPDDNPGYDPAIPVC